VDPLVASDLEIARATPPGERLAQAIELMETGLRLKRANLRRAMPEATSAEIDAAFERWLFADE
jgi:hypothetical protein